MPAPSSVLSVEYLPRVKTLNVLVRGEHVVDGLGPPRTVQTLGSNARLTWRNHELQTEAARAPSFPRAGACAVSCTGCRSRIAGSTSFVFKMLPSESWIELVECWSCHKDEFAGVDPLFRAGRGVVLVGVDHVLMNREDVAACPCSPADETALNVRLNMETVRFEFSDGTAISHSLEAVFEQLLRALFDGHSAWKFCFSARPDSPVLYIWLLSWDIYHSGQDVHRLEPAVKIGFSVQRQRVADAECFLHRCEDADRLASIMALLQAKTCYESITGDEGIEYAVCYLARQQ